MPGTDSPDYAAMQYSGRRAGQPARATCMAWFRRARRWPRSSVLPKTYHKASVGYGAVALPAGADPTGAIEEMRADHDPLRARTACRRTWWTRPSAARLRRPSSSATPFPGWPRSGQRRWPQKAATLAEEDIDAIRKVTLADVNRVAKQYLLNASTITSTLKPVNSGGPVAEKGFGGSGTGDLGAHQAGDVAGLGRGAAREAAGARQLHCGLRHDAAQRHSPDRAHRHDQPHRHRDRER